MPVSQTNQPDGKSKGIPTVILAIGGAFLGMIVAVAIFFGSGMADPKPVVTKLKEPEVPKDTAAAKAKLKTRKTEQASSKFETSLKDALVSGNIAMATRLATTKEPAMTAPFLALCRQYAADPKPATRAAVASALGAHLADKPAEDADLIKMMDDPDKKVVLACVDTLESLKPCPAGYVRKAFSVAGKASTGPEVRERIAGWFKNLSPLPDNLVTVFALESDTKAVELRPVVAEALSQGKIDPKNGMDLARKFVADANPKVAAAGIRMISQFRKSNRAEALSALLVALDSAQADIRETSAAELGSFGKIESTDLPAIIKSLGQGGDESRSRACGLAGSLGEQAKPALVALAKLAKAPSSPALMAAAISAMGMIGKAAEPEIGAVRDGLASSNAAVRGASVVALAKISRDAKSLAALLESVGDADPVVSKAASSGIDSMVPPPGTPEDLKVLESMLSGKPPQVRAKVFSIAAALGPDAKPLAAKAVEALDDADRSVMVQAGLALMSQPDRQAATLAKMQQGLLGAVSSPAKEPLALAWLDFLAKSGPKAAPAIPTLRRVLGPEQRTAAILEGAIKAAGAMGKEGIPLVPDLLNHVGEAVNPPTDTIDNFTAAFLKARHNQAVVNAIAAMGPMAIPEMEKLIARPQIGARFFALLVFDAMGAEAKDAIPAIRKLASADNEKSPLVNGTAVTVLGRVEAATRK